jgi:hypothetical protein
MDDSVMVTASLAIQVHGSRNEAQRTLPKKSLSDFPTAPKLDAIGVLHTRPECALWRHVARVARSLAPESLSPTPGRVSPRSRSSGGGRY